MINDTPVIVGIATYNGPGRRESLREALNSLLVQGVDDIRVYCNDYKPIELLESSLYESVLFVYPGDDGLYLHNGDMGDIGKFWSFCGSIESAFCLTCDDDLIYPPDYVETLVAGIERHDRRAVVGFHGREYYGPVESYYRSLDGDIKAGKAKVHRVLGSVYIEALCTIMSTGATGWHTSLFDGHPITLDDFRHKGELAVNMADIWFSKKCNSLGIQRIVLPHRKGWIRHTDKIDTSRKDEPETLFWRHYDSDELQTEVFNSEKWTL